MPYDQYCWDVFVSHNRKEKVWVRQVVDQWRELGLKVFFDEDSIGPGEDIVTSIEDAIASSRHVVLVISQASVESKWVAMEASIAVFQDPSANDRRLIPVLLDPLSPERIRLSIRRLRRVDLTINHRVRDEYHLLLKALRVSTKPLPDPPPLSAAEFKSATRVLTEADRPTSAGQLAIRDRASVTLVLNRDFDAFTTVEREYVLDVIASQLDLRDVRFVSSRPGSVILTLELS